MKYGEIVNLGRHKLMCGDATNREDVSKLVGDEKINLVLTDPPYGMKAQNKAGTIGHVDKRKVAEWMQRESYPDGIATKKYPMLIGDNSQESARKNYEIVKDLTDKLIIWGGQYFADFLPVNGGWLFWNKQTSLPSFSDGELAYTSIGKRVKMYTHMWNGVFREGAQNLNGKTRYHPTQKPVELFMKILDDYSKPDNIILDCFGGSGTTLIACEMAGRTCFMMEISPEYCNIICERYEKLKHERGHIRTDFCS